MTPIEVLRLKHNCAVVPANHKANPKTKEDLVFPVRLTQRPLRVTVLGNK